MRDHDPLQASFDGHPDASGVLPLAQRARAGDAAALAALFERFREPLRRIVRIRMSDQLRHAGALDSLDIVAQSFAKAWTKLDDFELRSERAVLSWLARIAERQIMDELDKVRASKRGSRRTFRIDDLLGQSFGSSGGFDPAADDTLPEGHAQRAELCRIVDEAVQELDGKDKEVILLRTYGNADWEDVARLIDAPNVKAAQATHYRARTRLASILARRMPGEFRGES